MAEIIANVITYGFFGLIILVGVLLPSYTIFALIRLIYKKITLSKEDYIQWKKDNLAKVKQGNSSSFSDDFIPSAGDPTHNIYGEPL